MTGVIILTVIVAVLLVIYANTTDAPECTCDSNQGRKPCTCHD